MKQLCAILLAGCSAAFGGDFEACFIPGEALEYKVSWMGLPLAWSRSTTETFEEEGRRLVRIRMVSQTYKAYAHIYKVDDVTEVVVDPATGLPLRLDVVVNEGGISRSHFTTFHHEKKVAIFQDRISKDIREVPIEAGTRDLISFIYCSRFQELDRLAGMEHRVYVDGRVKKLGMAIREHDEIKLPQYGKVPSIEIEPIADFDGLFLRQGNIFFWISNRGRRVVTCIRAKVPVGNITARLEAVGGPGDDFWVQQ